MMFEVSPPNRPTRIVAGLVVLGIGIGITRIPGFLSTFSGLGLFVTGLGFAYFNIYEAMTEFLRKRSEDPYDLSRLWDDPLPESGANIEPDEGAQEDVVYCHRCGASISAAFSICPDCGHRLGF
jgi:hypothetical protein